MNPDVVVGKDALYALVNVLKQDKTIGLVTTQVIYNGRKLNPNPCAWNKSGLLRWLIGGRCSGRCCGDFRADWLEGKWI